MALIKQTSRMLLFTLMVTLVACTTVQPWERGNLAKPQMALDPHPLQSAYGRTTMVAVKRRQVAMPHKGGGCGCY